MLLTVGGNRDAQPWTAFEGADIEAGYKQSVGDGQLSQVEKAQRPIV